MNIEAREMCLVTGEVTFKVYVNLLVPKEDAQDEEGMKDLFISKAVDELDNADDEAEYIDEVPVLVSKETAEEFEYQVICNDDWAKIIQESTAIRDIGCTCTEKDCESCKQEFSSNL